MSTVVVAFFAWLNTFFVRHEIQSSEQQKENKKYYNHVPAIPVPYQTGWSSRGLKLGVVSYHFHVMLLLYTVSNRQQERNKNKRHTHTHTKKKNKKKQIIQPPHHTPQIIHTTIHETKSTRNTKHETKQSSKSKSKRMKESREKTRARATGQDVPCQLGTRERGGGAGMAWQDGGGRRRVTLHSREAKRAGRTDQRGRKTWAKTGGENPKSPNPKPQTPNPNHLSNHGVINLHFFPRRLHMYDFITQSVFVV